MRLAIFRWGIHQTKGQKGELRLTTGHWYQFEGRLSDLLDNYHGHESMLKHRSLKTHYPFRRVVAKVSTILRIEHENAQKLESVLSTWLTCRSARKSAPSNHLQHPHLAVRAAHSLRVSFGPAARQRPPWGIWVTPQRKKKAK